MYLLPLFLNTIMEDYLIIIAIVGAVRIGMLIGELIPNEWLGIDDDE
jgi:hypothetical protein